jgi:hypothetical protein
MTVKCKTCGIEMNAMGSFDCRCGMSAAPDDFSFQKLEDTITFHPQPEHLFTAIVEQQQKAHRAERLEVASRVFAARVNVLCMSTAVWSSTDQARQSVDDAIQLIAAVDAKP